MKIKRTKTFLKTFNKFPRKIQEKIISRLDLFLSNPNEQILNIHELTGELKGIKSFNVSGDLRVWYMENKEKEIVLILLKVGTHSQLY